MSEAAEFPQAIPSDAVCEKCKEPIGRADSIALREVDAKTNACFGPVAWYHRACASGRNRRARRSAEARERRRIQ